MGNENAAGAEAGAVAAGLATLRLSDDDDDDDDDVPSPAAASVVASSRCTAAYAVERRLLRWPGPGGGML